MPTFISSIQRLLFFNKNLNQKTNPIRYLTTFLINYLVMKIINILIILLLLIGLGYILFVPERSPMSSSYAALSPEEYHVIVEKGTEAPFSGKYNQFFEKGSYHCKRCDAELYRSDHKFASTCGWPSFDDEVETSVKKQMDADGRRTEILCANCDAHLGHIFEGEGFTAKNIRHCVNSISLVFKPDSKSDIQENASSKKTAYFAGGCFWGVEHLFQTQTGVISAVSGYMGGDLDNPSYQDVIQKNTGHYEVVKVEYDPQKTNYETLGRYFFEIHDPTQRNGQGPDIGPQYLSVIFFQTDEEQQIADKLIRILEEKGYQIATQILPKTDAIPFWEAEDYHQDYYKKKNSNPYCHFYQKRF